MNCMVHSIGDNYHIIIPVKNINPDIDSKIQQISDHIESLLNVKNSEYTRDTLAEEILVLLLEEIK